MRQSSHLSNVWFSITPLQVASGHGCWVTTTDGEEYLDFLAGISDLFLFVALGAWAIAFIGFAFNLWKCISAQRCEKATLPAF